MPGTPPTTPRLAIPRFATTDPDQVPTHLNQVSDQVDTLAARIDSGLAAAPPAAGIVNRFYRETDTGILKVDTGSALAHITPGPHASRHQDGGADALVVREAMMDTGATGLAKGSFSAYRNAALSLTSPNAVVFDTDSGTDAWDVSSWYDPTNGRFTPQVAGIYRFNWLVTANPTPAATVYFIAALMKNASASAINGPPTWQTGSATPVAAGGSALAKANGTTDFFQVRLTHNNGAAVALFTGFTQTFFQGELVGRA